MTFEQLTPAMRSPIDAHLAAVDGALRDAGVPEPQRLGVIDDLRTQVAEMLAERGASPSNDDIGAVLARLDPPAEFAAAWASTRPGGLTIPRPGMETVARVSFWCAVGGIPLGVVAGMIASLSGHDGGLSGFLLFVGLESIAILTGIAARRHQLARVGAWTALALLVATFACTLFPKHPHPPVPAEQTIGPPPP